MPRLAEMGVSVVGSLGRTKGLVLLVFIVECRFMAHGVFETGYALKQVKGGNLARFVLKKVWLSGGLALPAGPVVPGALVLWSIGRGAGFWQYDVLVASFSLVLDTVHLSLDSARLLRRSIHQSRLSCCWS